MEGTYQLEEREEETTVVSLLRGTLLRSAERRRGRIRERTIHWSEEDERRYGSGERRDERKGSSVRETVNRRRTHETRKRIGESSHSIDKKMDRSERDSAAEMDTKTDGSETKFREVLLSESIDKSLILSNPLYNSVVGHNR
ncbi:hypothetical protein PENTCL1PPCAC_20598 [Pristionchus entomophagus]|uniref:Uncharacterized protein n=1 Tax=Pristionchus entomophagus TaxID=358040 RepID=A0AAV5TW24_9BILA|nr:hypothetical protein PENTCL1PPCAC_20598 [Pristionchus entomophagus]